MKLWDRRRIEVKPYIAQTLPTYLWIMNSDEPGSDIIPRFQENAGEAL
jgi:hypothetical protein